MVSWNCRALLAVRPTVFRKKRDFLLSLINGSAILALQEVHGNLTRFLAAFPSVEQTHLIFSSFHPDPAVGGVVSLMPRFGCFGGTVERSVDTRENIGVGVDFAAEHHAVDELQVLRCLLERVNAAVNNDI